MPRRRRPPLVGLSPRLLRHPPKEMGFRGKTLQYLEQSVATWVMNHDAIAVMVPSVLRDSQDDGAGLAAQRFAERLDGLILQGGADIHPSCYGEAPRYPDALTDVVRDRFELELLRAFIEQDKPVLGICRGMQLINVLLGGTLYQDLVEDRQASHPHVVADAAEEYRHGILLEPGGWLSSLYDGIGPAQVNSIHHQGIARLGGGLHAEAHSHDGVIEAIRQPALRFLVGVQWHPEFHDHRFPDLLPSAPLMEAFLDCTGGRSQTGKLPRYP